MKETVGYIISAVLFFLAVISALTSLFAPSGLFASALLFLAGFGVLYYVRRQPPMQPPARAKQTIVQEISVQELRYWFKQETRSFVEPLNAEGERLVAEIKGKLSDVQKICGEALRASEREIERGEKLHKARGMRKVTRYFLEVSRDVSLPDQISFKSLNELSGDLKEKLDAVAQARAVWFPLISPLFIRARKKLDDGFRGIANSLKNVNSFLSTEYSKVKKIEDTFLMIDELLESTDTLEKVTKSKQETESAVKGLEKKIEDRQRKIMEIETRSEIADLIAANETVANLERRVKYSLRHLRKPFMKLKRSTLGTKQKLPSLNASKLNEYLSNPLSALAAEEEGYPILKEILRILSVAVKEGKLDLKASRMRKAQEEITKIVKKDALLPLQKRCKAAYLQQRRLQSSKAVKTLQSKRAELQEELKALQRRKEIKSSRLALRRSEYAENLEKIESQKKEIKEMVRETTEKNVKIRFEMAKWLET